MNLKNIRLIQKFIIFLLIAFSFYVIFFELGKAPLDNWDEAWYGQMTKEMIQTKDFIVLHWNYAISLDKMPFPIWLNVILASILGLSEFSLRLTSAISGFLLIIFVTYFSYKKYGFVPAIFSYATLVFNNIFIWRARSGNIDSLTALLTFGCFYFILSKKSSRYLILGTLFGILYLTRGTFVLLPLLIFLLHEMIYKKEQIARNIKNYAKLIILFLTIPILWLIAGYKSAGASFLSFYLFHSDHDVASISASTLNKNYLLHTYYSLQRRYFYVFLVGVAYLIAKIRSAENFLLLLFSSLLIIFLSFAQKDNDWYLVPAMPFWSIAIAFGIFHILNILKRFKLDTIFKVAFLSIVIVISYKTYTVNILPILGTTSAAGEKIAGEYIKNHSNPNNIVVRIDHLYPSIIYYSDRKVLSSPQNNESDRANFIARNTLIKQVNSHKVKLISGTTDEINTLLEESGLTNYKRIDLSDQEKLLVLE